MGKNKLQVGQALYRENCIVCHDIDVPAGESPKLGPNSRRRSGREKTPKGSPATREYFRSLIRFRNGGIMPAFQEDDCG